MHGIYWERVYSDGSCEVYPRQWPLVDEAAVTSGSAAADGFEGTLRVARSARREGKR